MTNTMKMMELNDEMLDAVNGGGIFDVISDAWDTFTDAVETVVETTVEFVTNPVEKTTEFVKYISDQVKNIEPLKFIA